MTDNNENIDYEMLIDTDAPYVVKVPLRKGSDTVVTHTLKPYNQGHINLFERKGNNQVSINSRSEVDTDALAKDKALVYLYELLAESTDHYTGKDWLKKVPITQKIVVAQAIVKNYYISKEKVKAKFGPQYVVESEHNVIYLLSRNNEMFYLSIHIMREPDFEQISEYKRIKTSSETLAKRNKVVIKPQLTYQRYCDLYDQLLIEANGYKINDCEKIPPLHKVDVVLDLFALVDGGIEEAAGN